MSVFSFLLYFALIGNIRDALRDQFYDETIEQEVYTQTIDHLEDVIFWSDIGTLLILSLFSYFLADKTMRPIQKAFEDQRRFSADASHELRTPLAIMQSEAEIVLRDKNSGSKEYKKTINSNLEEVGRMKKIIEDLLLMARSNQKVRNEAISKIDLSALAHKIILKMKPVAEIKNLTLEQKLEKNLLIKGDISYLEHAILNIIQNAIEYTQKGNVSVESFAKNGTAFLKVIDTGVGISAKDLPHILKRFYKADSSRENKKGSAGLGLAIADQIIRDHDGNITIESKLGKGTSITIGFPSVK
jgi:signal transduction histidine kinase